ncbi:MAG: hypothetical protein Q9183_007612 [Haloplaca sp. 2 TL-2023]
MHPQNLSGKPLAVEELPGEIMLPMGETCPTSLSRRAELNRRVNAGCIAGAVGVGASITATCAAVGFGIAGPFGLVAAPFACAGATYFATRAVHNKCNGKRDMTPPRLLLDAGPTLLEARAGPAELAAHDFCAITNDLPVCPTTRQGLLEFHGCDGTGSTVEAGVDLEDFTQAGEGTVVSADAGAINF